MAVFSSVVWNLKVHSPEMAFPYRTIEGWKITKTCAAPVIASKKKKKKKRRKKKKKKAAKYKWKIYEVHCGKWRQRRRLWALKTKTNGGF
jgi:hypothetical protein